MYRVKLKHRQTDTHTHTQTQAHRQCADICRQCIYNLGANIYIDNVDIDNDISTMHKFSKVLSIERYFLYAVSLNPKPQTLNPKPQTLTGPKDIVYNDSM